MNELQAAIALAQTHALEIEQRVAEQLLRVSRLALEGKTEEMQAVRLEIARLEESLTRIKAGIEGISRRLGAA